MDDIVTRLRNNFATKDYPMLKDHCHCCAIPKEWGGHHDNCLYDQAADEIERLRKWAEYEHAGYCRCAGGNPECVNKAYEVWKSMQ